VASGVSARPPPARRPSSTASTRSGSTGGSVVISVAISVANDDGERFTETRSFRASTCLTDLSLPQVER
jgi:hypothetical protein